MTCHIDGAGRQTTGVSIIFENDEIVLEKYLEDESIVRLYYRNGEFVLE